MHQDYDDLYKEPPAHAGLQRAELTLRCTIGDAKIVRGGTKRDIAYRMAEDAYLVHKLGGWPARIENETDFDIADFVFNHTHYDECSNWWFFRRS